MLEFHVVCSIDLWKRSAHNTFRRSLKKQQLGLLCICTECLYVSTFSVCCTFLILTHLLPLYRDSNGSFTNTLACLSDLGITDPTQDDILLVKEVTELTSTRGAFIIATGIVRSGCWGPAHKTIMFLT